MNKKIASLATLFAAGAFAAVAATPVVHTVKTSSDTTVTEKGCGAGKDKKDASCGKDKKDQSCGKDKKAASCGKDKKAQSCGKDKKAASCGKDKKDAKDASCGKGSCGGGK